MTSHAAEQVEQANDAFPNLVVPWKPACLLAWNNQHNQHNLFLKLVNRNMNCLKKRHTTSPKGIARIWLFWLCWLFRPFIHAGSQGTTKFFYLFLLVPKPCRR